MMPRRWIERSLLTALNKSLQNMWGEIHIKEMMQTHLRGKLFFRTPRPEHCSQPCESSLENS